MDIIQQKQNILIIEIFPKNASQNFFQEIQITENNKYKCSICNKIISSTEKYECDICHYSIYCSEECANKSEKHNLLDQKYREMLIEEFNLNKFFKEDLLHRFGDNNKKGLVGLVNLGNTCYMNSALQCLSNTYDLTKYFIDKLFEYDINRGNRLGSNGTVATVYYKLINELWYGKSESFFPTDFIKTFRESKKDLLYGQQDSQEFLSLLLDQLHEDLNRISNKPYIELFEKQENETENQASKRWWEIHKKREDSIIVDLFNGQFRSEITCSVCKKSSITYDPFMFLSLPMPKTKITLEFKIFSLENCTLFNYIYNDGSNISNLKEQAEEFLNKDNSKCKKTVKIVELDENKNIKSVYITDPKNKNNKNNDLLFNILKKNNELILYEMFENSKNQNYYDIYVYLADNNEKINKLYDENEGKKIINVLSYPFLLQLFESTTLGELQEILIKRLEDFFVESDKFNVKKDIKNQTKILDLNYIHGPPKLVLGFFSYANKCDYCNKKKTDKPFCSIFNKITNKDTAIKVFIQKYRIDIKSNDPIVLYATSDFFDKTKKIFNNLEIFTGNSKFLTTKVIHEELELTDLLNLFGEDIKFEEENLWYCSNCKKHQNATQKLKIYKAPNYLIVQIKRFKIKKNFNCENTLVGDKNTEFVHYPINDFDLSNYVVGEDKKEAIYDLYGVVQHFGRLNGGHYTALCKIYDNSWREFNDSKIIGVDVNKIVTQNAYLLFYKRKGLGK